MSKHANRPLAILGGTFDPVHLGHLRVAWEAAEFLDADVHLMPANVPPHRAQPVASAQQRVAILRTALQGQDRLILDDRELRREGPSYSVDTLRDIRAQWGAGAPVALLIGADSLAALPQWKDWRTLFDLAHFVIAARPGAAQDGRLPEPLPSFLQERWTDSVADLTSRAAGRVLALRNPLHQGSATAVRTLIAAGQPWRQLVPEAVADYIQRHDLYLNRPAGPASL